MKKRIVIISVILSLLFATNVSAAKWSKYFGSNSGWMEGTKARLVRNSSAKWTAKVKDIGWGGCWGGYVYKKVNVKKNNTYRISFTLKSTKFKKWVFVKIANSTDSKKYAWAKWINCKKGKTIKVNKTFKAKHNGSKIYFGIGGDYGDRKGYDKDAKARYKLAPSKKLDDRLPDSYSGDHKTTIKCKKFSLYCTRYGYSGSSSRKKKIKKVVIYYY